MNCIVTGANGFIGNALTEYLLSKGHYVTAIIRPHAELRKMADGLTVLRSNLEEEEELYSVLAGRSYDVFYHLAWEGTSGAGRADYEIQMRNVYCTHKSYALASRLKCKRYIYAGSIMEYECMNCLSQQENNIPRSMIYNVAKLTADFMTKIEAAESKTEYICAAISNVYGEGEDSARFVNVMLKKLIKNEVLELTTGEQLYDFIYITDAVRALELLAQRGVKNRSYYIGNTKRHQLKYFVEKMKETVGSDSELRFGAIPFQGVESSYLELRTDVLEKELCFTPKTDFEEGIRKTADWIRGRM